MIKKVDSSMKFGNHEEVFSEFLLKEIKGRAWLIVPIHVHSNLDIKEYPNSRGFPLLEKDSISRRRLIRKFAKRSSSLSTIIPKGCPRKLEIQCLSHLHLISGFNTKYSCEITSREKNFTYLLRREFSLATDLFWPLHGRIRHSNQDGLTKSQVDQNSESQLALLAMDLRTMYNIEPEIRGSKRVRANSSSVSCDVIVSPKEKPGWPLLVIPVPPSSNNSSTIKLENVKSEFLENQLKIDLLIIIAESWGCKRFNYEHLKIATSHFSQENIIGEGGCSNVYKGNLENGEIVAVKVWKPYMEAWDDFSLLVKIVSSIKHKHIVPLSGICLENGLLISVHDYFPRGNLEDYLHGDKSENVLPWKLRFNVAVSIAEAMNYLHNECADPIIHRDIKSSNVLLTDELQPKLSDFGLAIWGPSDCGYSLHHDVAGTIGYIAPEYFMYGKISDKIDVYAFGVLLLELLTGRRPISAKVPKGQESLVKWAENMLKQGDYEKLIDPKLQGDFDVDQMERMALVARICISQSPRVRPKASQIVKLLKDYKDVEEPFNLHRFYPEKAGYEEDSEDSFSDFEFRDCPSLDEDSESMSPSSNITNSTFSCSRQNKCRIMLKDLLNQPQD